VKGVYVSGDIEFALQRIDQRLKSVIDHNAHKFVVRVAEKLVKHTQMQSLFNLRFKDNVDRALYEVIMTHAMAAEKLGPGGFGRFLELLCKYLNGSPDERVIPVPRHASIGDLDRAVEHFGAQGDSRTQAMIKEALRLAGFGGRIIVEKTPSSTPSVELVRGYTFNLQQLLPIDFSFIKPRISCIDGHIEEISEIHHLLEAAASAKEPCVLFVRGISEDVKHTLKVNYDRGSLRVIPIGVRFDFDGINSLVDLSIVSGCDLISSLKGDLISSIKFDELPCVDKVTMFKGRVVIIGTKTKDAVKVHVANLRKRRLEENDDDKGVLLDKRIKSLSPNHVVIRLPDDSDFVTNSQSIDYVLRAVRSIIDYGVDEKGMPVTTELAAQHYAAKCIQTLRQIGAYLD
jgi:hypothetical protein